MPSTMVEIMDREPGLSTAPGIYLQFREGQAYTVFDITPEEADRLADNLKQAANKSRKRFLAQ